MIKDAITKYEEKTGETFSYGKDLSLSIFVPPFRDEFMLYKVGIEDGVKYVWLDQMWGSMHNFTPFIKMLCEFAGIDVIATATTRSPKVHCRKWLMTYIPERDYEYEGRKYHFLVGNIEGLMNGTKWQKED